MAGIMVTDFRVRRGFWRHGKTMALVARCGPGSVHALIALWDYATESAPTGELGAISAAQLGAHAMAPMLCPGITAEQFGTALVELGWVDVAEDGSLALHDWLEEQGNIALRLTNQNNGRKPKPKRTRSETEATRKRLGIDRPSETQTRTGPDRTGPERHAPASPPPSPPGNLSLVQNPGKQSEPEGPIETQAQELVAAFQAVAKRRGPPLQVPPVNMATLRIAEQALADPVTRATWREALMTLDQQGPPDWWGRSKPGGELDAGMKLGLQAFLKPANFARFASGEFTGAAPPDPMAGLTPAERQAAKDAREAAEAEAESKRIREENRARREAKAAKSSP